jgi:hypothetical protein
MRWPAPSHPQSGQPPTAHRDPSEERDLKDTIEIWSENKLTSDEGEEAEEKGVEEANQVEAGPYGMGYARGYTGRPTCMLLRLKHQYGRFMGGHLQGIEW